MPAATSPSLHNPLDSATLPLQRTAQLQQMIQQRVGLAEQLLKKSRQSMANQIAVVTARLQQSGEQIKTPW